MRRWMKQPGTGFTLIEMVISLTLVGIVLVSLGSMLTLSVQATPQPTDTASVVRGAAFPFAVMAEELGSATGFGSVTATGVVFTIADRTGDASPETVEYSWSGTPGDPLLRVVNGGAPEAMIDSVQDAEFEAFTQEHTLVKRYAGAGTTFEKEMSANTSPLGGIVANLSSRTPRLELNEGFFQRMDSSAVPDDALYWAPEYVDVLLERDSDPGAVRLEVRTTVGGAPTGVAIASTVVRSSDLGNESWVRIGVPGTLRLDPVTRLGVALICIEGDRTVETRVYEAGVFPSEPAILRSTDGGDSWSKSLTTRMAYRLRGSYYPQAKAETFNETTVSSVRFSVSPSGPENARFETRVDLPAPARLSP